MTEVLLDELWKELDDADENRAEGGGDDDPTQVIAGGRAKKPRMTNYKKLNTTLDANLFGHAVYLLLFEARRRAESRLNQHRSPKKAISLLSVAALRKHEICTSQCPTELLPVALYMVPYETAPEGLARMRTAAHMFLPAESVVVAGRLGLLSTGECAKCTLHICSPYCPFALERSYPFLFADPDDEDRYWADAWWHKTPLASNHIPETLYRCTQHNKFHICASTCEYMLDGQSGVNVCPLSLRAVADDVKNSFGDGVGTAEQQEKTAEAKGNPDDDNDKRRRSLTNARAWLLNAATVVKGGKRVRRHAGDRAKFADGGGGTTPHRRKISKAARTTPEDQQTRVVSVASANEVARCRPFNGGGQLESATTISAIARVPFAERSSKHNHEFCLDRLHELYHRVERRARFTLSEQINRLVLFGNSLVFATCCERAAAIFHQLLFGRERVAIEQNRFEKAEPKVARAVDHYEQHCVATGTPIVVMQSIALHETALNVQTRRFPAYELSAEMYACLETYYALRAVIFYFGLLSLPVRRQSMMNADEIESIRTAFSFEQFCVIIYDLMRTGYTVRNVTLLARDNFIVERLFPSSSVLRQMGMLEKPCTNIKGLITTIFKVAQPHGISLQYVFDTTLPWTRIAELSMMTNPARRVVEELLDRREEYLHALRMVRPPSPDRLNKD